MQRNHFIESIQESFGLLFNTSIKPPLGHKPSDDNNNPFRQVSKLKMLYQPGWLLTKSHQIRQNQ